MCFRCMFCHICWDSPYILTVKRLTKFPDEQENNVVSNALPSLWSTPYLPDCLHISLRHTLCQCTSCARLEAGLDKYIAYAPAVVSYLHKNDWESTIKIYLQYHAILTAVRTRNVHGHYLHLLLDFFLIYEYGDMVGSDNSMLCSSLSVMDVSSSRIQAMHIHLLRGSGFGAKPEEKG